MSNEKLNDDNRAMIRDEINSLVGVLHEDCDLSLNDILSEMLLFASNSISNSKVDVYNRIEYPDIEEDEDIFEDTDGYENSYALDEINHFKNRLTQFELSISEKSVDQWEIRAISDYLSELLIKCDDSTKELFKNEYDLLNEKTIPLIREAELVYARENIKKASDREVHNIKSISSIIKQLDDSETKLKKYNSLEDTDRNKIKQVKENCAKYRARKKLMEAEIAERTVNLKKYQKLVTEAEVLLEQGLACNFWEYKFPRIK